MLSDIIDEERHEKIKWHVDNPWDWAKFVCKRVFLTPAGKQDT